MIQGSLAHARPVLGGLALLGALGTGCGSPSVPPPPSPDGGTGLAGVKVPDGSLAGTWGLFIEVSTLIQVPLLGQKTAGSNGGRLVKRTWDAATQRYSESFKWCTYDVFEVAGTKTVLDPSALPKLSEVAYTSHVDGMAGTYQTDNLVVLWGLHNLPDLLQTALPTHDNYKSPPQSDWVWDEDQDGQPGVTVHTTGMLSGWGNSISRSVYSLDGTVVTPDHLTGLAHFQKGNQSTLEASTSFALRTSDSQPNPDTGASWFDAVRLADGASCDDVVGVMSDGGLATHRPF